LQTSERGSAVAEFLFLVIPLIICLSASAQVSWTSYSKTQLRVEAATAAFEAGQPDSDLSNIQQKVKANVAARLKACSSPVVNAQNGLSRVEIKLPAWNVLGLLNVFVPSITVSSHAVNET
jgi:Flp pilus assembly protein TadG